MGLTAGAISTAIAYPFHFLKIKTIFISEGIGVAKIKGNMGFNPTKVAGAFFDGGYGMRGLFTGFSTQLTGRLIFLSIRNNLYKMMYDSLKPKKTNNDLMMGHKSALSGIAALAGGLVTNFYNVKNVLEIGDLGRKEKYQRLKEGVVWNKALCVNLLRVVLVNSAFIIPYNFAKEELWVYFGDHLTFNRLVAIGYAAACGVLVVQPFEHMRCRLQYPSANPAKNRVQYRAGIAGMMDVFRSMAANETVYSFWAGGSASFIQMYLMMMSTFYVCDLWTEALNRR